MFVNDNPAPDHLVWLQWIKEKLVKKEAELSQDSCTVDFGGRDPSLGRAAFWNEVNTISAHHCTTIPQVVFLQGRG